MIQIEWQRTLIELSESENLLEAFDFFTKAMHRKINESEDIRARYEALKKAWENNSISKQETVDRWIPVTERLPENEPVLASLDGYVFYSDYDKLLGWLLIHPVTGDTYPMTPDAWMPLPEPYGERRVINE